MNIRRRLFYYALLFARWACWLRAIDPKLVDLWIANERQQIKQQKI
jgi:hypothetical protein